MTCEQLLWRLESGFEQCEFCRHPYHIEVAYYCVECDRPICPVCAIIVLAQPAVLCPQCAKEGED